MADTKPSISDLKRLFARSGNQCAFPKCLAQLADGKTFLGEVCHIKGDKPASARFDPNQTPAERHGYDNLIVLCPTHHTVIDNDPEAYTVERLQKLKAEHEAHTKPIADSAADQIVQTFVDQTISNLSQTGGFSAHTVHAENISIGAPAADPVVRARQMRSIETLWEILCKLRAEFSDLIFIDTVLTPKEIDDHLKLIQIIPLVDTARKYTNQEYIAKKLNQANFEQGEKERPFISERLWAVIYVIGALYGRLAFLFSVSFKKREYQDWRTDNGIDQHLRSILAGNIVDFVKNQPTYGLQTAIRHLEGLFLSEASKITQS
jgi:hypothetical protein